MTSYCDVMTVDDKDNIWIFQKLKALQREANPSTQLCFRLSNIKQQKKRKINERRSIREIK